MEKRNVDIFLKSWNKQPIPIFSISFFFGLILLYSPGKAHAATSSGWNMDMGASSSAESNSNRRLNTASRDKWTYRFEAPNFKLSHQGRRQHINIGYTAVLFTDFSKKLGNDVFHQAHAELERKLSSRFKVKLANQYSITPKQVTVPGSVRSNVTQINSATADAQYDWFKNKRSRIAQTFGINRTDFIGRRGQDYTEVRSGLIFNHHLNKRLNATVQGDGGYRENVGANDLYTGQASVGFTYKPNPRLKTKFNSGIQGLFFEQRSAKLGLLFNNSTTYQATGKNSVELSVDHRLSTDINGAPFRQTQARLADSYQINRDQHIEIVGIARITSNGSNINKDKLWEYGPQVVYKPFSNTSFNASYLYQRNRGSLSTNDFNNHQIIGGIKISFF